MGNALKELGRGLNRAWENVSDGWRELLSRTGSALTRFVPRNSEAAQAATDAQGGFPRWGMLAGEVIEGEKSIVVRLELPGIAREDCDIRLEDGTLRIRGEKRLDREEAGASYYLSERAYGCFERVIPLPPGVEADSAKASYRDGVLTVEFARRPSSSRRRITVN